MVFILDDEARVKLSGKAGFDYINASLIEVI